MTLYKRNLPANNLSRKAGNIFEKTVQYPDPGADRRVFGDGRPVF